MEKLETKELINVINEYIRNNYEYNYADIFEDSIVYHLENGKEIYINIDLDKSEVL